MIGPLDLVMLDSSTHISRRVQRSEIAGSGRRGLLARGPRRHRSPRPEPGTPRNVGNEEPFFRVGFALARRIPSG